MKLTLIFTVTKISTFFWCDMESEFWRPWFRGLDFISRNFQSCRSLKIISSGDQMFVDI